MAGSMRWRTRSAPSCHQLCVRPVSWRTLAGSLKKIWQETEKTVGSVKPSRSGARKPASTRMSLFSRTTMSLEAARKPALEPPPKPRLAGSARSLTCGNAERTNSGLPSVKPASTRMSLFSRKTMSLEAARKRALDPPPKPRLAGSARSLTCGNAERTNSGLPSVEPLSTTTISLAGLAASADTTEGRNFARRSLPFQVGMTTEAQTGGAVPAGADEGVGPPVRDGTSLRSKSVAASAKAPMNTRNGESRSSGSERRKRFRSGMSTGGDSGAEADLAAQLHPAGSTEERDLLGEPGAFLLQTERPLGALVEFVLGMVESFDGLHQCIGLLLNVGGLLDDFGGEVGFNA